MKIAIISSGIVNVNTFLKNHIKFLIQHYNASITIITNVAANEEIYKEFKKLNVKIINISSSTFISLISSIYCSKSNNETLSLSGILLT